MPTNQIPAAGSWYVNRTGKLVKVALLLFDEGTPTRILLEYLDGMRIVIGMEAWMQFDLRVYSLRIENRDELWNV